MKQEIEERIVGFIKHRLIKRDDEDAECSICRRGYGSTKYFYIFGDVQLCDVCFSTFKKVKP